MTPVPLSPHGGSAEPKWATLQDAMAAHKDKLLYGTAFAIRGEDGPYRRVDPATIESLPAGESRETAPSYEEDGSASGRHPSPGSRADARREAER